MTCPYANERDPKKIPYPHFHEDGSRHYLHPDLGVPVVGPSPKELEEGLQALDEDSRRAEQSLRDPANAEEYITEIQKQNEDDPFYSHGHVLHVFCVHVEQGIRDSGTTIVVETEQKYIRAGDAHYSGTYIDPPDSDSYFMDYPKTVQGLAELLFNCLPYYFPTARFKILAHDMEGIEPIKVLTSTQGILIHVSKLPNRETDFDSAVKELSLTLMREVPNDRRGR